MAWQYSYDPYPMHMKILQQQTWCTFSQVWTFIKNNAYLTYDKYTKEQIIDEIKFLKTTIPFSKTRRFPNSVYVHVDNLLVRTALDKIVLSTDQISYTSAFSLLASNFTMDSFEKEKLVVYDRETFESTYKLIWRKS